MRSARISSSYLHWSFPQGCNTQDRRGRSCSSPETRQILLCTTALSCQLKTLPRNYRIVLTLVMHAAGIPADLWRTWYTARGLNRACCTRVTTYYEYKLHYYCQWIGFRAHRADVDSLRCNNAAVPTRPGHTVLVRSWSTGVHPAIRSHRRSMRS